MTQNTPNHEGGSVDGTETATPTHEIIGRSENDQLSNEFDFVQILVVKINNPYGRGVVARHIYKADHVDGGYDNDTIYHSVKYYWPESKPQEGEGPITDGSDKIPFDVEGSDRDSIVADCESNATRDPELELALIHDRATNIEQNQLSLPDDIISLQ